MRIFHSPDHTEHVGRSELNEGRIVPCFERPERAERVLARVREVGLGELSDADEFGLEPLQRIHRPEFLEFLATAWERWSSEHGDLDGLPLNWPVRGMRNDRVPKHIDGQLSYYSFDAGTPITAGAWRAARGAANAALSGARAIANGERSAFALVRPPGHHAGPDTYGGYCFLNNAAIAAQSLSDHGASRVAILDVDYHHGNGTQTIFYDRSDVLFVSLHADPALEFPYFLGYADERGSGEGLDANLNLPLPFGTDYARFATALDEAAAAIDRFRADALVVSLGVDTYREDPISQFALETSDFPALGRQIARLDRPTLFVMEGGYAVDALGVNMVGVLEGFEGER